MSTHHHDHGHKGHDRGQDDRHHDHQRAHHTHGHGDDHNHGHSHRHGVVDPSIVSSKRGLWAVKWSFIGLMATALFQVAVVAASGSIALFADTIHNFADAATAIPLGIAFLFARKHPSSRFTFGYGRVEDLAGLAVLLTILSSAVVAGYESINRFLHPQDIHYLWAVAFASVIGFLGNEGVAIFRIRVGREISSAALVADGYHARVDGWTSLAVLAGAVGVWLGYPLSDPIMGLVITVAIFGIVIQSGREIFIRMLDGIDPAVIDEIRHTASHVPEVKEITDIRARWLGHRLHAEVNITVDSRLTIAEGHAVANELRHELLHALSHLSLVVIHVDPPEQSGERHHQIERHAHDGRPRTRTRPSGEAPRPAAKSIEPWTHSMSPFGTSRLLVCPRPESAAEGKPDESAIGLNRRNWTQSGRNKQNIERSRRPWLCENPECLETTRMVFLRAIEIEPAYELSGP